MSDPTQYPPGTVAVATVMGVPNVQVTRGEGIFEGKWYTNRPIAGSGTSFYDTVVTDVHPLVVIDPEDPEQVERLSDLLLTCRAAGPAIAHSGVAAALREFATPTTPTPAEPTDPAARVIDRDGYVWASHEGTWHHLSSGHCRAARVWAELVEAHGPIEVRL